MLKQLSKIIRRVSTVVLSGIIFLAAVTPSHAKIVFKGEFLIDDNGSDTFIIDAGDDVTGDVHLQFGNSLSETITFDATNNWFEFSDDINLNQHQLKNAVLDNLAAAPLSPNPGQIYYDTLNGNTYIWNGALWEDITATGGSGNDDLDTVYVADLDKVLDVNDSLGLEFNSTVTSNIIFDMQSTGDVTFQDAGTTYAIFTDTGAFQLDNLQLDANTVSSTNANGNVNLDPNGNGFVNLSANTNVTGNLGLGTTPNFNFHLFDSTSSAAHEWQVFDNGADQVSILTGTQDPTATATDADTGSIFLNAATGKVYIKTDDGLTTNWNESGLSGDLIDALAGTFGTPSITNKFVTDQDPRLAATSGAFGEVALGTHLDYPATNQTVNNDFIYYTRVFLPADTTVSNFAIFTTQSKTGNVNFGIYSDASGSPNTKLAEVGVTASSSPVDNWWQFSLGTPLDITVAGLYWLAYASSEEPKAHQYLGAEDLFIPFRVETKSAASALLPATATPDAKGGNYNLPYIAAFE